MRILGLDPGSRVTGYALLEGRGSSPRLLAAGRLAPASKLELGARLAALTAQLDELLDTLGPQVAVLEEPFHGASSRSLIVLAQARGALLATLGRRGLPIHELSPAAVKKGLTGNGRAPKDQVARMVALLLGPEWGDLPHDASDAVATALCFAQGAALRRAVERAGVPS